MFYGKELKILIICILGLMISISSLGKNGTSDETEKPTPMEMELQIFYKQPSFEKFIQLTSNIANSDKDSPEKSLLPIFSSMVLDEHPEYAKEILANFPKYSAKEKELLYQSLIASGNSDAINTINNLHHYRSKIKPQYTVEQINHLNIDNNPDNLDHLWAAYYATGREEYLLKMIQYVNTDNFILSAAYEMVNKKNYKEIADLMKKRYPNNSKEMFYRTAVVASALWSLESNSQRDNEINQKMQQIFKQNENLNYIKKIQATGE